jgi:hypothetical protein
MNGRPTKVAIRIRPPSSLRSMKIKIARQIRDSNALITKERQTFPHSADTIREVNSGSRVPARIINACMKGSLKCLIRLMD